MGQVIHFGAIIPKIDGEACKPLRANSSSNNKKYLQGMERLAAQLLTVEGAVAVNSATAVGPPRARISSVGVSNVVAIPLYTSQIAKLSTLWREFHKKGMFLSHFASYSPEMVQTAQTAKMVGFRLRRSREALGLTQKEMAELCGVSEGNYSDFENGKRRISVNAALRLSDNTPLTMDWIYKGVMDVGLTKTLRQTG